MIKFFSKLKRSEGFTLLELMVVIGILAIMMLAAVPSYLGHQQDAEVNNVMRDTKTIEDAAMNFRIDVGQEGWPYVEGNHIAEGDLDLGEDNEGNSLELSNFFDGTAPVAGETDGDIYEIDQDAIDERTQRLYQDIEEDGEMNYAIIVSGEYQGEVISTKAVEDSNDKLWIHPDRTWHEDDDNGENGED